MKSVLDCIVSYYPTYFATGNGVPVNLLAVLESTRHQAIVETLRNEPDEEKQKQLKGTMNCYTVAGIFSSRNNAGLITPSGLACVDLDAAQGYKTSSLLNQLRNIPYIAYAGLSCRGKRLFLIVPFATGAYEQHYTRLIQSFTDMGLPMGDNCHKSMAQPRIVSYNTDATHWFNHTATPYDLLPEPKPVYTYGPVPTTLTGDEIEHAVSYINTKHTFKTGNRHHYIKALAGYCQYKGIPYTTTLQTCQCYEQPGFTKAEIKGIVQYFYSKK